MPVPVQDDFLAPPFAFTVMDTMQTLRQPDDCSIAFM
jgi:hypothetical protein